MFAASNAWYTYSGTDNDTVLSSRVRIVRNLKNYRFPPMLGKDDAEAVYQTVVSAFQRLPAADGLHPIRLDTLDSIAKKIFEERNIIPANLERNFGTGVIVRDDGILSATVNVKDHIRLSAFYAGFELQKCFMLSKNIIDTLAETLEFSAVQDFGYLSSDVMSIGSGIKCSVLCSLPGYSLSNKIQGKIEALTKRNFEVHAYYAQNTKRLLGYLYLISTKSAAGYTDEVQISMILSAIRELINEERDLRDSLVNAQRWRIQDDVIKAFSIAKNAYLLDVKDTIDLVFKIKLGINLGFIEGLSSEACLALLYQTQTAHIAFLMLNGTFHLEEPFQLDELRIERIRAILVQEILKRAELRIPSTAKNGK